MSQKYEEIKEDEDVKSAKEQGKKERQKPTGKVTNEVKSEIPEKSLEGKTEITKGEEQDPDEEEALSDDEKRILIVLNFVSSHKGSLRITGWQIKDFLEEIFPGKEIDEIYSKLKEKEFISKTTKDSDEFWLTYKGKEEAEKYKDLLKAVFESLGSKLAVFLEKNELLKRALYLGYVNEWKLRSYIPKIRNKLSETEQVLIIFFTSREFLQTSIVEGIVRRSRNEQRESIEEKLEEFCKDSDFLKALAMIRLDEIKDKLGIDTIASTYYKNYSEALSEIMEKTKADDILGKLLLLGITESENLFDVDIASILAKAENILKLKELFKFDKDKFRERLGVDWGLFLNTKKTIEGSTPSDLKELLHTNAVLLYKDKLSVRKEVKEVYDEVYREIEEKLKEKVRGIDNAFVLPFYEREKLKELEGKIIISLHAEDWWSRKYYYPAIKEDELEKNIVLLVSPKEIGFEVGKLTADRERILELPDKNIEFNAIGEIENLDEIKSKFDTCPWVLEKEYESVKKARDIIREKKIPRISLEEAIEEIKRDIRLVQMLFIISDKHTSFTGMKYYSESDMWRDVSLNMQRLHPSLTEEELEDLKNRITSVAERARIDLVHFSNTKLVYEKCRKEINKEIIERTVQLDKEAKKALYTFLVLVSNEKDSYFDWGKGELKFLSLYKLMFGEGFTGSREDLWHLINKTGLGVEATWIHSRGPRKARLVWALKLPGYILVVHEKGKN